VETNVLIPGNTWISHKDIDGESGLSTYHYECDEEVRDIAKELQGAMLRAEEELLSPLIGEPFPCGVDYSLGPIWIH
jgi:hypothetical protein